MKKWKRALAALLAAALCALALPGCMPPVEPLPEAAPKTILTILHGQSTSDAGLEDMLTEKLAAAFPDVELEWESMDWGDYFATELQARFAAGEVPDIIIGKAQDVAGYQNTGYLGAFGDEFKALLRPEALESVTLDGVLYGVPYNALYQGVLYNKNLFYRYGLSVPETPEEMEAVIRRLEEVGITPFATHFQENWYTANIWMQFAVNGLFSQTPTWGDQFREGEVSFQDDAAAAQIFQQVQTVQQHSWEDAFVVTQSECVKRFAEEKAAMFVTGSWTVQALRITRPEMQLGLFPYPNATGDSKLLFEPNITFMKNGQGQHTQLVDQLIYAIASDHAFSAAAAEFTQTEPMLQGVEAETLSMVQPDISHYRGAARVQDVSLGNRQLVWYFQDLCARQTLLWLEGKTELPEVLRYADENRKVSGG